MLPQVDRTIITERYRKLSFCRVKKKSHIFVIITMDMVVFVILINDRDMMHFLLSI